MHERKAMRWFRGPFLCLSILFVLTLGCRTMPPNLKPPKEPEKLTLPPEEPRYTNAAWPENVVATGEKTKTKADPFAGMPKGGPGAGGAGGMGGMGGAGGMSPTTGISGPGGGR